MATMPQWAQELLINACLQMGKEDLPAVTWRRTGARVQRERYGVVVKYPPHQMTSGYAFVSENRIVITAGTDRGDQKRALLHELAHLLRPVGEHHSAAFWDTAWSLYRWAKLPIRATAKREGEYRKGATLAYARSRRSQKDEDDGVATAETH